MRVISKSLRLFNRLVRFLRNIFSVNPMNNSPKMRRSQISLDELVDWDSEVDNRRNNSRLLLNTALRGSNTI